jgi:hypothetical protein
MGSMRSRLGHQNCISEAIWPLSDGDNRRRRIYSRTKQIATPGSVPLARASDDDHSSGTSVTARLKRPNPEASGEQPLSHTPPRQGDGGIASLFGLAPGGVYRAPDVTTGTGALLPHRFTLTSIRCVAASRSTQASGGLFSVALSLGSPPLDVIQHPALWSPDFPPLAKTARRDHLVSFVLL